jgi:hypothetical protein
MLCPVFIVMLCVTMMSIIYAECLYANCRGAELTIVPDFIELYIA